MTDKTPSLEHAYALKSPEDNRQLYDDWATSYDAEFAVRSDYRIHEHVAHAFAQAGGQGPVLDIGAGTGLLGAALVGLGVGPVDATDISSGMLDEASKKSVYNRLFVSDVTNGLPVDDETYAGVTSSGTFTIGHLGPDPIDELLRVAKRGAVIAISVNCGHYYSAEFPTKIESIRPKTANMSFFEVPIYGGASTGDHANDRAYVIVFQRA